MRLRYEMSLSSFHLSTSPQYLGLRSHLGARCEETRALVSPHAEVVDGWRLVHYEGGLTRVSPSFIQ